MVGSMSHIPEILLYRGTELERTPCCWKCKELNPETRSEYSFGGEHGPTLIHKCTTCGRRVTPLVAWATGAKWFKLSSIGFGLISFILIPPIYLFVENHEDKVGIIGIAALFVLISVGCWAFFQLICSRRRSILEEIDRFPKPKLPPKKPNSLPPKIN